MSRNFGLVPRDVRDEAYGDWPHVDFAYQQLKELDRDVVAWLWRWVKEAAFWLAIVAIALAAYFAWAATAGARDDGRYANSPLHAWFDQLASGKGLCCSFADGVSIPDVDWDTEGDHYRVRLDGQHWIVVPDSAVVTEPNRDGRAFVWPYQDTDGVTQIRCFLPGAGV
jgi:hypothetical protein